MPIDNNAINIAIEDLRYLVANERRIYDTAYNCYFKKMFHVSLEVEKQAFYDLCYKYSEIKMILEAAHLPNPQIQRTMVSFATNYNNLATAYASIQRGFADYERNLAMGLNEPKAIVAGLVFFNKKLTSRIKVNEYLLKLMSEMFLMPGGMPGPAPRMY